MPVTKRSPAKKKRTKTAKATNIRKHLTADDIAGALKVLRHHIKKNDVRVALYVLDQYFGKPAPQTDLSEAPKKPVNLRLTNEFFDKLAQKYFPKPFENA